MNFVIDLTHRRVSGLVVEPRSALSKGLRFISSWGLRMFTLSCAHDKTKNIFFISLPSSKNYHLSYSILQTGCVCKKFI